MGIWSCIAALLFAGSANAVTQTEDLWCWGYNDRGQAEAPPGLGAINNLCVGYQHGCALTEIGLVICWGSDDYGQSTVPPGLSAVVGLDCGAFHTCSWDSGGAVTCWGRNDDGQSTVPAGLGFVTQVTAGWNDNCVVTLTGAVSCWGKDDEGELTVPGDLFTVRSADLGPRHMCAVSVDNNAACWGSNDFGQSDVPDIGNKWHEVASGGNHTCGLRTNGKVRCFGDSSKQQLNVPGFFSNGWNIASGSTYSCGGRVGIMCWGSNPDGASITPSELVSRPFLVRLFGRTTCAFAPKSTTTTTASTTTTETTTASTSTHTTITFTSTSTSTTISTTSSTTKTSTTVTSTATTVTITTSTTTATTITVTTVTNTAPSTTLTVTTTTATTSTTSTRTTTTLTTTSSTTSSSSISSSTTSTTSTTSSSSSTTTTTSTTSSTNTTTTSFTTSTTTTTSSSTSSTSSTTYSTSTSSTTVSSTTTTTFTTYTTTVTAAEYFFWSVEADATNASRSLVNHARTNPGHWIEETPIGQAQAVTIDPETFDGLSTPYINVGNSVLLPAALLRELGEPVVVLVTHLTPEHMARKANESMHNLGDVHSTADVSLFFVRSGEQVQWQGQTEDDIFVRVSDRPEPSGRIGPGYCVKGEEDAWSHERARRPWQSKVTDAYELAVAPSFQPKEFPSEQDLLELDNANNTTVLNMTGVWCSSDQLAVFGFLLQPVYVMRCEGASVVGAEGLENEDLWFLSRRAVFLYCMVLFLALAHLYAQRSDNLDKGLDRDRLAERLLMTQLTAPGRQSGHGQRLPLNKRNNSLRTVPQASITLLIRCSLVTERHLSSLKSYSAEVLRMSFGRRGFLVRFWIFFRAFHPLTVLHGPPVDLSCTKHAKLLTDTILFSLALLAFVFSGMGEILHGSCDYDCPDDGFSWALVYFLVMLFVLACGLPSRLLASYLVPREIERRANVRCDMDRRASEVSFGGGRDTMRMDYRITTVDSEGRGARMSHRGSDAGARMSHRGSDAGARMSHRGSDAGSRMSHRGSDAGSRMSHRGSDGDGRGPRMSRISSDASYVRPRMSHMSSDGRGPRMSHVSSDGTMANRLSVCESEQSTEKMKKARRVRRKEQAFWWLGSIWTFLHLLVTMAFIAHTAQRDAWKWEMAFALLLLHIFVVKPLVVALILTIWTSVVVHYWPEVLGETHKSPLPLVRRESTSTPSKDDILRELGSEGSSGSSRGSFLQMGSERSSRSSRTSVNMGSENSTKSSRSSTSRASRLLGLKGDDLNVQVLEGIDELQELELDEDTEEAVKNIANRGITVSQMLDFYQRLGTVVMPQFDPVLATTEDVVRQAIIPLSKADADMVYGRPLRIKLGILSITEYTGRECDVFCRCEVLHRQATQLQTWPVPIVGLQEVDFSIESEILGTEKYDTLELSLIEADTEHRFCSGRLRAKNLDGDHEVQLINNGNQPVGTIQVMLTEAITPLAPRIARAPIVPSSNQGYLEWCGDDERPNQPHSSALAPEFCWAGSTPQKTAPTPIVDTEVRVTEQASRYAVNKVNSLKPPPRLPENRKVEGTSYAMAVGESTLPHKMVTHSWSGCFTNLVAAIIADALGLDTYGQLLPLLGAGDLEKLRSDIGAVDKLDACYWIDVFCVNQHKGICADTPNLVDSMGVTIVACSCVTPKEASGPNCEIDKMPSVIGHLHTRWAELGIEFSHVVAVDPGYGIFDRAWCLAELHETYLRNMPASFLLHSYTDLDAQTQLAVVDGIDIRTSETTQKEDKQQILGKIDDPDTFNEHVKSVVNFRLRNPTAPPTTRRSMVNVLIDNLLQ